MSNNTNNNNNQYDNTYYEDDDSSVYFIYFIFFLVAILYGMPYLYKGYKTMCHKNEEEAEDQENNYVPEDEMMDLTDRELKPDYDSHDDDEENKYI